MIVLLSEGSTDVLTELAAQLVITDWLVSAFRSPVVPCRIRGGGLVPTAIHEANHFVAAQKLPTGPALHGKSLVACPARAGWKHRMSAAQQLGTPLSRRRLHLVTP